MVASCRQQHLNDAPRSTPDLQNSLALQNLRRQQGTENVGQEIQRTVVPVVACVTSPLVAEVIDRAAGQRLLHVSTLRIWICILRRTPRQCKDRNPEWRMKIWGCSDIEPEHD